MPDSVWLFCPTCFSSSGLLVVSGDFELQIGILVDDGVVSFLLNVGYLGRTLCYVGIGVTCTITC